MQSPCLSSVHEAVLAAGEVKTGGGPRHRSLTHVFFVWLILRTQQQVALHSPNLLRWHVKVEGCFLGIDGLEESALC